MSFLKLFKAGTPETNYTFYDNDGTPPLLSGWNPLKWGGGGFVTGISIADDGVQVVRTDTYGMYVRATSGGVWEQTTTIDRMPSGHLGLDGNGDRLTDAHGCYECAIAPSNSQIIYKMILNKIYKSTNRGATWTHLDDWDTTLMEPNHGTYRGNGPHMAINPTDPNHVIACAEGFIGQTTDGGTTWTAISGITLPDTANGGFVCFDPTTPTTIYICSAGNGFWRSTDGGSSFSAAVIGVGDPTDCHSMAVGVDGVLMVCALTGTTTNLRRWNGTAWASMTAASNEGWQSVAYDPDNSGHFYAISPDGELAYTANNGTAWTLIPTRARVATDVPWIADDNDSFYTCGRILFDPSRTNYLYSTQGVGLFVANPPTTAITTTWNSETNGIEQMVAFNIKSVPSGGGLILTAHDRAVMMQTDLTAFPTSYGLDYDPINAIRYGNDFDYATTTPSVIAGIQTHGNDNAFGLSTDGGATWVEKTLPSDNASRGGCIACSTATNFCMTGIFDDARMKYTNDAGTSWSFATFTGVTMPTTGNTGWGQVAIMNGGTRRILCADRVTSGTFYALNIGNGAGGGAPGIYRSTDGGATWTQRYAGLPPVHAASGSDHDALYYAAQLEAVPGNAGHLFLTAGEAGGAPSLKMLYSTDGGTTLTEVPNVREPEHFGFGKEFGGSNTYPAIYFSGWLSGTYGVYRCINGHEAVTSWTWTQLEDFPLGITHFVTAVTGDLNTYGLCYVAWGGVGGAYYNPP